MNKIYEDCSKANIFVSKAHFNDESGVIVACDDWYDPLNKNKGFKVKVAPKVNMFSQEDEITSEEEYFIEFGSYPGIFNDFLNDNHRKRFYKKYFDKNHNLNV